MSFQNLTTEAPHNTFNVPFALRKIKDIVLHLTLSLATGLRKATRLSRPSSEDVLRVERHREDVRNHAIRMMVMGR
jgi:hypothetical protein